MKNPLNDTDTCIRLWYFAFVRGNAIAALLFEAVEAMQAGIEVLFWTHGNNNDSHDGT